MSKLSTDKRNNLANGTFALPGRRYPINDENHARNALARASQFATPLEQELIKRKVHQKFPEIGQK